MKTKPTLGKIILACLSLVTGSALAGPTTNFTWVGTGGGVPNTITFSNCWSTLSNGPAGPMAARPSMGAYDTLVFDGGTTPLFLTNGPGDLAGGFAGSPGGSIHLTSTQTGNVTIVQSNTWQDAGFGTGRLRLGTNMIIVDAGAGALTFGNNGTTPMAIVWNSPSTLNSFTNNSSNPVTFNQDVAWVMGGGNNHNLFCAGSGAGTGKFIFGCALQAVNTGGSVVTLHCASNSYVIVSNAPIVGAAYAGGQGNINVDSGGTLALATPNAIFGATTASLQVNAGGTIDSATPNLVLGAGIQIWGGDFSFLGTENLDTGLGIVTNTGNRIITVANKTLTVSGLFRGSTASVTKAGPGKMLLNCTSGYTGGTTVSNGVLQMGTGNAGSFPSGIGTSASEALTVQGGTFDMNGNSITVSALNGNGGTVDTTGGSATLTVGDFNANGSFAGTIANTSGSLNLVKNGTGTLTLGGASTYNGGTAVNSGTVLVTNTSGSGTGSGAVTVASSATLGGTGTIAGSVNWQAGSFGAFTLTAVSGANTTPLTVSGSVTLNNNAVTINIPGVIPLDPGTYTLMTYNNTGSSGSFATSAVYTGAGVSPGTASTVSTTAGTVTLNVVSTLNGAHSTWTNTAPGNWSVAANWRDDGGNNSVPHAAGDLAKLGFGTSNITVTLDANETVGGVLFSNLNSFNIADAGKTLTFDNSNGGAAIGASGGSSNTIAAAVSLNDNLAVSLIPGVGLSFTNVVSSTSPTRTLTLHGTGTVTLLGNNTYGPAAGTVGTIISGGLTNQLGNNNAFGAGDVIVTNGNETVRALGALTLANNFSLAGAPMSLDNNGNNVTLSGTISGTGALGKNGAGTLTLNSANSYTNGTTISAGTVKLGNAAAIPGGAGTGNLNMGTNTTLDLNGQTPVVLNGVNAAVGTGAIIDSLSGGPVSLTLGANDAFATFTGFIKNTSGSLALVKAGMGTQTLAGTNTFTGGTTINTGTLTLGNGQTNTAGSLGLIATGLGTGAVADNSVLAFNMAGTNFFTNDISGSGGLTLANTNLSLFLTSGNNTFSSNIVINGGALYISNTASLGTAPKTLIITGGGTSQRTELHIANNITIPSSINYQLSSANGGFTIVNENGNNTIQGDVAFPFGGGDAFISVKSGFLTMTGNAGSDGNANGRAFRLGGAGNGLYSGSMHDVDSIGSPGTALNCGISKVDTGTWTVSGISTTSGTLNAGTNPAVGNPGTHGILALTGTWEGPAAVNAGGTLTTGPGASVSNLTVNSGGRFAPGGFGAIGTFTVSNLVTLNGGSTNYFQINKSSVPPNTTVNTGFVGPGQGATAGAALIIVSNLTGAPPIVGGDMFHLFNQQVTNGNLVTISAPAGFDFINNLAVDGSIRTVNITRTNIMTHLVGNQLTLSWAGDHQFWRLLMETNPPPGGLVPTNWVPVPGFDTNTTSFTTTIDPTVGTTFYRLVYP